MKNEVDEYLLHRVIGLQSVITALSHTLINKKVIDEESLLLNLKVFKELTAHTDGQHDSFQAVIDSIELKNVWVPHVIQGGKSNNQDPEDN